MTAAESPSIEVRLEPVPGVGTTFPGPFSPKAGGDADAERAQDLSEAARRPERLSTTRRVESEVTPVGYGTDPNMVTPRSPWPKTLTLYQRHVIAALSDIILPSSRTDPAPSEIGIADFFDDWLSAPYSGQAADRAQIASGLIRLDQIAHGRFANEFLRLSDKQKRTVVDELITNDGNDRTFFLRFRYLVVGGYFTSDVGMQIIGYRGNVPLRKPAKVSPEALTIIERELQKLGL